VLAHVYFVCVRHVLVSTQKENTHTRAHVGGVGFPSMYVLLDLSCVDRCCVAWRDWSIGSSGPSGGRSRVPHASVSNVSLGRAVEGVRGSLLFLDLCFFNPPVSSHMLSTIDGSQPTAMFHTNVA
jgi:hypothetical protein